MSVPPLSERCEYLSGKWIALADAALQPIAAKYCGALAGQSWAVREDLTEAPPHLGFPGNVATCVIEIGANSTVRRDGPATVDLQRGGEYQHWLAVKQAIGPAGIARAEALASHLHGPAALQSEGKPPEGLVAVILGELHDHMARRTVENPDLRHRLRRLKIEHHAKELAERGFTILPRVLPPETVTEIRDDVLDVTERSKGYAIQGVATRSQTYIDVMLHPLMRSLVDSALGLGFTLGTSVAQVKETGPSIIPIHTDYSYIPEPFPEFALMAQSIWAMDDWSEASGPTVMIPGSHKSGRAPVPGTDKEEGGVPIVMPAGSVCVFASNMWHWAIARTEPGSRVSLHTVYNRPFVRGFDNYTVVDEDLLQRNSPLLSTLLGQDHPFEKTGPDGIDWGRAAYTASLVNWGKAAGRSGDERYIHAAKIFADLDLEQSDIPAGG